ncbi:MAG: EAL domain-containing protein [Synechococcales cyanobacterium CRU_2_2]|nr:EAL domain-containing protein [Synechococcales cyanobacterium CRU_2_2]
MQTNSFLRLDIRTQAILRESEARFRRLFEEIPNIPMQGYDRDRRVIFWNQASERLYGYDEKTAMGQRIEDLIIPGELREPIVQLIDNWIAGGPAIPPAELELLNQAGERVPVFSSHVVLENTQGYREMYCVDLDLRDRKQAEQAIRASEAKYRSIFENITQGLFQIDSNGRYISVNPFLVTLLGYDSAEVLMTHLTHPEQPFYVDPNRYCELLQQLNKTGEVRNFESQVYRRDGSKIWISETQNAVRDSQGILLYYEGRLEDITLRHQAEAQLRYDAIHDPLTSLYNRAYVAEQLEQILQWQGSNRQGLWALLLIDLDRFKVINDSLGYVVGDEILKILAQRLRSALRSQDVLARLGGDEFVILLQDLALPREIFAIATRCMEALRLPLTLPSGTFSVEASMGIAQGTLAYHSADEVFRGADIAMYRAKAEGGGHPVLFEQEMHPRALARWELEQELKQALAQEALQLFYQPIIDLQTEKLTGFEALLRWNHPERGWISPAEFVPIAEETGLIHPLSWWVFRKAAQQLQCWQMQFPQAKHLTMNVNLSVVQLKQTDLVERLQRLLQECDLQGDRLKLEVTEANFFTVSESTLQIFYDLKQLGMGLCIDDFGTGYSSLSRLHQLPLDVLKIDRAFVDDLDFDLRKQAIAHSIIMLAHGLGASVVAEGIETESQLQILRQFGCEFGQGYWFSRPVAAEQAAAWIEAI